VGRIDHLFDPAASFRASERRP